MMAEKSIRDVFSVYQQSINEEQEIRDKIRETTRDIEKYTKPVLAILQRIHQDVSQDSLKAISGECRMILKDNIKPLFAELNEKVPSGTYYQFHDSWKFLTTKLCFAISLIHYLDTDTVVDRELIGEILGLSTDLKAEHLFLDLEDYLQGLLLLASELSRFTVNCVTKGDVRRPRKIFKTMLELQQGFSELNLKNDHLRRMFDSLKYDIKRVEQVIYDLTIRGLEGPEETKDEEASRKNTDPDAKEQTSDTPH